MKVLTTVTPTLRAKGSTLVGYFFRFQDKVPKGLDRHGNTWGGVQPQLPDGYTKSTQVHDFAPDTNSTATLRRLEPYVGR